MKEVEQIIDKSFIENGNKASGMHFEEIISYSCKKYHEEGKLYMRNPPMQRTAESDYKGTFNQNAVTNKQFEDFDVCHGLGAVCFVLVSGGGGALTVGKIERKRRRKGREN